MISYLSAITYDICDDIILILGVLYQIVYAISDRIAICEICVDSVIFVGIENRVINIWNIESSSYWGACYYHYQDK